MQSVRCAVKAIISNGNKFLVLKQAINGMEFWDLPGGKVEYNESPYQALHREVKEETGINIEIEKPLGMWWFFRLTDKVQVVCTTFICRPNGFEVVIPKNKESDSIEEFRWVTKLEFLSDKYNVSHPSLKDMINKVI